MVWIKDNKNNLSVRMNECCLMPLPFGKADGLIQSGSYCQNVFVD